MTEGLLFRLMVLPVAIRSKTLQTNPEEEVKVEESTARCISCAVPAAAPKVLAELLTVREVLDTVRLRVAASAPFQSSGETIVETGGSHRVESVAMVRARTWAVLTGTLSWLHSKGKAVSNV